MLRKKKKKRKRAVMLRNINRVEKRALRGREERPGGFGNRSENLGRHFR